MAVDPNSWQALFAPTAGKELASKPHRTFVNQLVQSLREGFSPGNLAQNLSGSNRGVKAGALKNFTQDIPSGGGTQTLDVRDAYAIHVSWEASTAGPWTLVLNNLLVGSPVSIQVTNTFGGNQTFKINATNGAGVAYTIKGKTQSAYTDLVATGVTVSSGSTEIFVGNSSTKGTTPDLQLLYD